jgi:hypothetical protein
LQNKDSMQQRIVIARGQMNQHASRLESQGGLYYPEGPEGPEGQGSPAPGYALESNPQSGHDLWGGRVLTQDEVDRRDAEDLAAAERAKQSAIDGSGFVPDVSGGDALELADRNKGKLRALLNAGADHETLMEWYYLYHWNSRALAHDLFYIDSIRRGREAMALQLENTHLQDATMMYRRLQELFDPDNQKYHDDEGRSRFWEKLSNSPKTAVELLKQVTAIQRLSVGMHPEAPGGVMQSTGESNSNNDGRGRCRGRSNGPCGPNGGVLRPAGRSNTLRPDEHGRISPEAHAAAGYSGGAPNKPTRGLGGHQLTPNAPASSSSEQGPSERARRIAQLLDLARARQAGSTPRSGRTSN